MAQLVIAARHGDLAEINELLAAGIDPNQEDRDGYTPLMEAASRDHEGAIIALIEAGADVNKKREPAEDTALHMAQQSNLPNIVELLLEAGANPNVSDAYKHIPIIDASARGYTEIVKLLIKYGANINISVYSSGGYRHLIGPPIFYAANNGHTEIVKLLLEQPTLVNQKDEHGKTITDLARAGKYRPEINKLILDKMTKMQRIEFNKLTGALPVKLKRRANPSYGHFGKAAPHVWETIGNFIGPKSGGRRRKTRAAKRARRLGRTHKRRI